MFSSPSLPDLPHSLSLPLSLCALLFSFSLLLPPSLPPSLPLSLLPSVSVSVCLCLSHPPSLFPPSSLFPSLSLSPLPSVAERSPKLESPFLSSSSLSSSLPLFLSASVLSSSLSPLLPRRKWFLDRNVSQMCSQANFESQGTQNYSSSFRKGVELLSDHLNLQ
jgi:hypothetical protein